MAGVTNEQKNDVYNMIEAVWSGFEIGDVIDPNHDFNDIIMDIHESMWKTNILIEFIDKRLKAGGACRHFEETSDLVFKTHLGMNKIEFCCEVINMIGAPNQITKQQWVHITEPFIVNVKTAGAYLSKLKRVGCVESDGALTNPLYTIKRCVTEEDLVCIKNTKAMEKFYPINNVVNGVQVIPEVKEVDYTKPETIEKSLVEMKPSTMGMYMFDYIHELRLRITVLSIDNTTFKRQVEKLTKDIGDLTIEKSTNVEELVKILEEVKGLKSDILQLTSMKNKLKRQNKNLKTIVPKTLNEKTFGQLYVTK